VEGVVNVGPEETSNPEHRLILLDVRKGREMH